MEPIRFTKGTDDLIEGLAIPYGGPLAGKDLDGERFTPDTDFAVGEYYPDDVGRPVYYDHGTKGSPIRTMIGRQVSVKDTAEGRFVQVQLERAHRYAARIRDLVKDGALHFSSGAVAHQADVAPDGTIKRWPWVELSLTPEPANPYATVAVKSARDDAGRLGYAQPDTDPAIDLDALAVKVVDELERRQAEAAAARQTEDGSAQGRADSLATLTEAELILAGEYDDA